MNSRLFTLATLGAVALARTHNETQPAEPELSDIDIIKQDKLAENMRIYDGLRGAWIGFNRGLYKSASASEMESMCMNDDSRALWEEAHKVTLGLDDLPENADMLTAMSDLLRVTANLTYCNWRDPVRDVMQYCAVVQKVPSTDGGVTEQMPCTVKLTMDRLTKNAFVLMSKSSNMAEIWADFPAEDPSML